MSAKNTGGRYRILLLLLIVILFAVVCTGLSRVRTQIRAANAERSALSSEVDLLHEENEQLQDALDKAEDPTYVQDLAREQLGVVSPGQKDFYDIGQK